jgi:hypothetical protein
LKFRRRILEAIDLAETEQIETVVITSEPNWKKENIIKRKTIVYETHMDPTVARVTGERLKNQLFTRYGFFKPKSEEIQFVSLEKFYEPYIVTSGRYFIDYYRKSSYPFKVDDGVKEVVILNTKFVPEGSRNAKTVKLDGEERLVNEAKSFLIVDKNGRDAQVDSLPSASSEKKPEKAIEKFEIEELPENVDVDLIRAKIASRPKGISRIIEEIFEITERTVIYTPRFRMIFKNTATNEEKALVIDGVSSRRIG